MKKLAIVSPMILPVPAVKGGAVEELITKIILGNEKKPTYQIDLYTVEDGALDNYHFYNTKVVQIKQSHAMKKTEKCRDKLKRVMKSERICRAIDRLVVKEVCKREYDCIIVENMSAIYRLLRKKINTPIYFHLHNHIDLYRTSMDIKLMERNEDTILTISEYMKQMVIQQAPKAKCKLLINAADFNKFYPREKNDSLRKQLGIAEKQVVFLYAGRLLPQKGVKELIQAFKLAKQTNDHITLLLVGTGMFEKHGKKLPYERDIEKMIKAEDSVIVKGFMLPEEMPQVYACADVGVIPSKWEEPFGMVALEMMGMCIPMIVTNKGGLAEIVDESCAKMIEVKGRFVEDLTDAIIYMAENPEERARMKDMLKVRMQLHQEFDDKYYFERFCSMID